VFFKGDNKHQQVKDCASEFQDLRPIHALDQYKLNIKKVSGGEWYIHCLLLNGTLLGWGYNSDGRVGISDLNIISEPTFIPFPNDDCIIDVCNSKAHSLALTGMYLMHNIFNMLQHWVKCMHGGYLIVPNLLAPFTR
jgi:alpha-tubulin suppressor-like RCC1 family protein